MSTNLSMMNVDSNSANIRNDKEEGKVKKKLTMSEMDKWFSEK